MIFTKIKIFAVQQCYVIVVRKLFLMEYKEILDSPDRLSGKDLLSKLTVDLAEIFD